MKKTTRIFSLLLSIVMLLGMFPLSVLAGETTGLDNFVKVNSYDDSVYSDVRFDDWFYDNVKSAYEYGLMIGKNNNLFDTEGNVTIAETMTIAARLHSIYYTGKADFEQSSPWYQVYADYCESNGIADPADYEITAKATRAQFAVILANALPEEAFESINKVADDAIPDVKLTDSFGAAVYKMYRAGILTGNDENGTFSPDSNIRRSEVAAIVTRMAAASLRLSITLGDEENENNEKTVFPKPLPWLIHPSTTDPDIDSDGDGITDEMEKQHGSDPYKRDTDGDGLDDYDELNWLNYNPSKNDTDGDGIPDCDEDYDGDGLTNLEEKRLGTSLVNKDTDFDGLNDYDEAIVYHTNPLIEDTDGDGASDFDEIMIGTDPLVPNSKFESTVDLGEANEVSPVVASATAITDGEGANTLSVTEITRHDNPLLDSTIPGYLGSAYNFNVDGTLLSGTISFQYDTSLGTVGQEFEPRIYYYDEETGLLEELPNQTVVDGVVSANVSHFSTYILLNKKEFDKVWNKEIKAPFISGEGQTSSAIDVVFVIDVSGSMYNYDRLSTAKTALNAFLDALGKQDRAALIKFHSVATTLSGLTSDIDSVKSFVSGLAANGQTSMYLGFEKAVNMLTETNQTYGYKMIVILSDGSDEPSTSYSAYYSNLVQRAKDNSIVVYTVGAGTSVDTSILTQIAHNTGGEYYAATVTSGITDAFSNIQAEIIDYTTDSNNDGISDYYTELIDNGTLTLSTGSIKLYDIIGRYGKECDDWDGDGLKNGEEIQVVKNGNKVFLKMYTNPIDPDSDSDGYDDFTEKEQGSDPMRWTVEGSSALNFLENNDLYAYVAWAESSAGEFSKLFDCKKTDEAKKFLINYFYDYAPQETIDKNQYAIAKLVEKEQKQKWLEFGINALKIIKDSIGIYNDFEALATTENDLNETQKAYFYDLSQKMKDGSSKFFITAESEEDLQNTIKNITDSINNDAFDAETNASIAKNLIDGIDNYQEYVNSIKDLLDKEKMPEEIRKAYEKSVGSIISYETQNSIQKAVASIQKAVNLVSTVTSIAKTAKSGVDMMKLSKSFHNATAFSENYKKFVQTKSRSLKGTDYLGVAINVADCYNSIWETANTYGKMQANRDAYMAYIDLLDYIGRSNEKYIANAAQEVADIVMNQSWDEYELELIGKDIIKTELKIAFNLAAKANPCVALAKLCVDIVKTGLSLSGLKDDAKATVYSEIMSMMSDGCINIINSYVYWEKQDRFSIDNEYQAYVNSYMVQLAQSRLVGEKAVYDMLTQDTLAKLISDFFRGSSDEDKEIIYKRTCNTIIAAANMLDFAHGGLQLSSKLPKYDHNSGVVNGVGGGGGGSR